MTQERHGAAVGGEGEEASPDSEIPVDEDLPVSSPQVATPVLQRGSVPRHDASESMRDASAGGALATAPPRSSSPAFSHGARSSSPSLSHSGRSSSPSLSNPARSSSPSLSNSGRSSSSQLGGTHVTPSSGVPSQGTAPRTGGTLQRPKLSLRIPDDEVARPASGEPHRAPMGSSLSFERSPGAPRQPSSPRWNTIPSPPLVEEGFPAADDNVVTARPAELEGMGPISPSRIISVGPSSAPKSEDDDGEPLSLRSLVEQVDGPPGTKAKPTAGVGPDSDEFPDESWTPYQPKVSSESQAPDTDRSRGTNLPPPDSDRQAESALAELQKALEISLSDAVMAVVSSEDSLLGPASGSSSDSLVSVPEMAGQSAEGVGAEPIAFELSRPKLTSEPDSEEISLEEVSDSQVETPARLRLSEAGQGDGLPPTVPPRPPQPSFAEARQAPAAAQAAASPGAPASPPPAPGGSVANATTPAASPLAPPHLSVDTPTQRRKVKPWWEELFNDDYLRTVPRITDDQIAQEASFIEDSLSLQSGAMILDLACGTGRHACELARRGYEVVGFDLSLSMLAKAAEEAQERSQKINFLQGDMREMTFEDTFDGIYCWNTSFGFFEDEKNLQVFTRVFKALKNGGQFLLDVVNRDFIVRQSPSLVWYEGDGCICMDEMQLDWITSRMKVKRTMMIDDGRTREIEYSIRVYSLHELGKLLHDLGFRVSQVSGLPSTPGVFFGGESPRTIILAEKP